MNIEQKQIKNKMFKAFLQIQKMEVPYSIKNKMLGALFGMTPNGWRVVGITKDALIRFKKYDFKYKSGMGINRSHIFPRHKVPTVHFFPVFYCRACAAFYHTIFICISLSYIQTLLN